LTFFLVISFFSFDLGPYLKPINEQMAELVAEKADQAVKAPETVEEKPAEEKPAAAAPAAGEEDAPEEESTAHFEPVVQLDEIEVKTHEEEEEVLWKWRGKLFVFGETLLNKGTGQKTWNERGIGEFKFLKHKEHQKIRALMRQERTMKVICNHVVDPRIQMQMNAGSDRSWVWSAFDFSDGELVETVFAIRFANSDIAQDFKKQFDTHQATMASLMSGEDAPGASEDAAAAEATAAIEGLAVKGGEDTSEEPAAATESSAGNGEEPSES